jgi:hypothetical protein
VDFFGTDETVEVRDGVKAVEGSRPCRRWDGKLDVDRRLLRGQVNTVNKLD